MVAELSAKSASAHEARCFVTAAEGRKTTMRIVPTTCHHALMSFNRAIIWGRGIVKGGNGELFKLLGTAQVTAERCP